MAEVVHRNLESMLPQLEALESSGIFSHDEIRIIVKRRRNHEYKMVRRPARLEDFLAAIQFELHLDSLRKHRKRKLGLATTRHDAERGIQNRLHVLFRRALKKFKGDVKLWLQYIEYSKCCGHKQSLSRTFGRVLAIHPNKPGLWVMAAKYEIEELNDLSSARTLLQQGLRANPCSKHLWLEYFRMELMHVDKIRRNRSSLNLEQGDVEAKVSEEFLAYKTANITFNQAVQNISDDPEFRLSFLPLAQLFDGTDDLQGSIYISLQVDFPTHPLTWDALAKRHWMTADPAQMTDELIEELETKSEVCFRDGLSAMEGDDVTTSQHWEKCLIWRLERQESYRNLSERLHEKGSQRLLSLFREAAHSNHLSVKMYEQFIHTLHSQGLHSELATMVVQATTVHPTSIELWLQRLKYHEDCNKGKTGCKTPRRGVTVEEVCKEALRKVSNEFSLQLWQYWIEHSISNGRSNEELEEIFQAGIDCGVAQITSALSIEFVNWANRVGGTRRARKIYKKLLERKPVSLSLYKKCIEVEKTVPPSEGSPSMKRLRDLFESMLRDYGASEPDLWLEYIQCEMTIGGGKVDNVGKLHWRAIKDLGSEFISDFVSRYSLLQY